MKDDANRKKQVHDDDTPDSFEESVADASTNPFAPENLALSNENLMEGNAEFSNILTNVKPRKPSKVEFIRTHPEPNYRARAGIIDMGFGEGIYVLAPQMAILMERDIKEVDLVVSSNWHGEVFIWPLPILPLDRTPSPWTVSARIAAEQARTKWVRLQSDMRAGQYHAIVASGSLGEPVWPDKTFAELAELAFGEERLIKSVDHPVVQKLQGRL